MHQFMVTFCQIQCVCNPFIFSNGPTVCKRIITYVFLYLRWLLCVCMFWNVHDSISAVSVCICGVKCLCVRACTWLQTYACMNESMYLDVSSVLVYVKTQIWEVVLAYFTSTWIILDSFALGDAALQEDSLKISCLPPTGPFVLCRYNFRQSPVTPVRGFSSALRKLHSCRGWEWSKWYCQNIVQYVLVACRKCRIGSYHVRSYPFIS